MITRFTRRFRRRSHADLLVALRDDTDHLLRVTDALLAQATS